MSKKKTSTVEKKSAVVQKAKRGKTLGEFLAKMDYAGQIREGIKTMLSETLMVEHEFRSALGIPADKFRRAVDSGGFDECQIKHDGKIWWSCQANIAKARKLKETYQ